jgi:DNA-binding NarL/FixJ family response regulator
MGNSCLVLADSHTEVLFGIRTLLEPLFDAILMVADERSLLRALEKNSPDLIVVDLSMRVAGEANVARRIKKSFPDIKFIVLSVHDEPAVAKECVEAGATAFVLKQSAVDDLVPAVQAVLRGETYVSSGVEGDW